MAEKFMKLNKKRIPWNKGVVGYYTSYKGTKLSNEHKNKLSISKIGKKLPPFTAEHKAKIGLANKGRILPPISDETRKKLSQSRIGKRHTEESKKKMSEKATGKIHSFETRKKLSLSHKGQKSSEETRKKISEANKGRIVSLETRIKIGLANSGDKNSSWKGGISKNPYPFEFNPSLKLKIRTRDSFTCCLCKKTEREELEELNRVLCVNHIDFDKNNCSEKNLNTLCLRCNIKINREREYWTNYFNTNGTL